LKTEANFMLAHAAPIGDARESAWPRAERLLDRVIYFVLLSLFVLFSIPYGAVEPWWEAGFEGLIFALSAMWVIQGWLGRSWRLTGLHLIIPMLALIAFAFTQTIPWWGATEAAGIHSQLTVSFDPYETRRFALKLLALTLAGALLLRYVSTKNRLRTLIHVIIGVGVASALFGITRQTMQQGADGFILPFLRPGEGYAQFVNRNHFAFLMEMSIGLVMGLVMGGGIRRHRWLIYLAAAAPLWTALVLSTSRGGIVSLLSQILFSAILFGAVRSPQPSAAPSFGMSRFGRLSRSLAARALLVACLALMIATSIVWIGGDSLASRLESLPVELKAAQSVERQGERRLEIWESTWQLIKAHPIAGAGFGSYGIAISQYHQNSGEVTPREAHNDYLELLASGGLIGVALGVWFVIVLLKTAHQRLQVTNRFRRAACYGALVGLFGVAAHSLVDFGLHITINALFFTALVVIATLDSRGTDEGDHASS
jgi:O-antigen ligase